MIKKSILIICISVLFYGCAVNNGVKNTNNKKLEMFAKLFTEHCFEFESTTSVENNAKQYSIWKASKQWKGTYEYIFQSVSYGLTPRNSGNCTVDLLVIHQGRILFTENETKEYISGITGYDIFSVENKMESNSNDEDISISEVIFKRHDSDTSYIMLQYPLERLGEYYVTLNYFY